MKALKGLLVYVGIVLAMILGIGILLFAGMYFFPNFRIMGVGVVHETGTRTAADINLADYSGYENIDISISSKRIAINIEGYDKENITSSLSLNNFGIAFDIVEYGIIRNVSLDGNTLKVNLNVTEPEGMISDTSSVFKVNIPNTKKYNITLKSTDGNIKLSKFNSAYNINQLNVSTTKGKFDLENVGEVINDQSNLTLNSLNLTTTSGRFRLDNVKNLTVYEPIKLFSSNGSFQFANVNAGFNVAGAGVSLKASSINSDINGFKFISENGNFEIDKLSTPAGAENTIVTEHCSIKVNEISGRTGILSTYGNINIGTTNSTTILQSEHGNVQVNLAKDDIRVQTNFGNINVLSYLRDGKFVSRKGDINVKSSGEYENGLHTEIENVDGKVIVDNKINLLIVRTTGTSKVDVTFREVKGGLADPNDVYEHIIQVGNYSSAIIYMPTSNYKTPFMFKAEGKISGEISGLTTEYEGDEVKSSSEYQYFPSASAESKAECFKSCSFLFTGTIEFRGYINR